MKANSDGEDFGLVVVVVNDLLELETRPGSWGPQIQLCETSAIVPRRQKSTV